MQLGHHAWRALMLAAALASPGRAEPTDLIGVWSFDGRQACKGGPAWVLSADGTYAEAMLPDLRAQAWGRWREHEGGILYTRAGPAATLSRSAPMHPLKIIERTPGRIVTVTHNRVRRVMHYCGQPHGDRRQ